MNKRKCSSFVTKAQLIDWTSLCRSSRRRRRREQKNETKTFQLIA